MTEQKTLDVRELAPKHRHGLIFDTYKSLANDESFILVNDHDPKPLYYQFAHEYKGQFAWEYREQGPDVWKVEIKRTSL